MSGLPVYKPVILRRGAPKMVSRGGGMMRLTLLALSLTLAPFCIPASPTPPPGLAFIPPSHPEIRYTGRFDTRKPDNVRFDWPGNMIELRFSGSSCAVKVRGDGGRYDITVGDSAFVMRFDTSEAVSQLVSGLDKSDSSAHTLRIFKRYEGLRGRVAEVKGFYIDKGESLCPLPHPRPARRIELIGSSIMLGFGAEADAVRCDNPPARSNAYLAFGMAAARALGAEAHIAAISGKGLVRNWRTPFLTAMRPFGPHYTRTIKSDPTSRWDFGSWIPHVVVTNFGTNDFSTRPYPPQEVFIAQYRSFINEVRSRYPGVQVVCAVSSREPARTYVRELVERERQDGNTQIHFYAYAPIPRRLLGCDWHPGTEAQAKIGADLAELIGPLLEGL